MTDEWISRAYTGGVEEPVSWAQLLSLFDAIFGEDTRSLKRYPDTMHHVHGSWVDAHGVTREATTLDEVQEAYLAETTFEVRFSGWREGGKFCEVRYFPGASPPTVSVRLQGKPDSIDRMIESVKQVFPIQRQVVFLSWTGDHAKAIAKVLVPIIQGRVPLGATVFFSDTDIIPGDDPLKTMLEDRLLPARVQVPILTRESHTSAWLIWETAAAWALRRLVIPVFVDIPPGMVVGPVASIRQGIRLGEADGINRLLGRVAQELGGVPPSAVTEAELEAIRTTISAPR